ncbi:hypothetical protein BDD43_1267 [Mucilaginibacter gracilis]|uniref:MalT-like TPR region domain-containing protein n=1 Tax=Mucilaginibacter gracilis TaxID=423350 RepID=A0A495IX96_9SPHI|nr:hypothetical protein [Mucilaginibacter gracilis]RKR81123.1 hypothetical protein BDD43_1267 [Mucilaginibacter gracilis]
MGKTFLLILLSVFTASAASAQFWKRTQQTRLPLIAPANTHTFNYLKSNPLKAVAVLPKVNFGRSRYSYDLEEAAIMKELYHTLRFRMYAEAIGSMNRLVVIYIDESRYSEAKWYLLQCNYFGHKCNNTHVIISSLMSLGMLKADIGEYEQAKQDLLDAKNICFEQGLKTIAADIDGKLKLVEAKRITNVKNDVQYAEVFENKKG